MATSSFGKVVKLDDAMAQKIADAPAQSLKKTHSGKETLRTIIDRALIRKIK